MGLKVIIFLGPPRKKSVQRQVVRYEFKGYVSKPTRLLGVALFRLLCAERGIPEEVIVFGYPNSDWDMLHELAAVPHSMPRFQQLGLRERIDAGGLQQEDTAPLEHFLSSFLGGVRVHTIVLEEGVRASMETSFFRALGRFVRKSDELHVDLSQDIVACGLFASAASSMLEHGSGVNLGGLYVANTFDNSLAGTPVMVIDHTEHMLSWASALALFRQSGLIGRLPELLEPLDATLAKAMRRINFCVSSRQYERLYDTARVMHEHFEALTAQPQTTMAHFFAVQLYRQEADWMLHAHLADWELEFARRALFAGDFLRAATLAQSAVVSAAIGNGARRVQTPYRQNVYRFLVDQRHQEDLYPVDPWPFLRIEKVRLILGGYHPVDKETGTIFKNEDTLQQFLERAISFAAVLVARFKRVPPA